MAAQIQPLTGTELDFVTNFVSKDFLYRYGTPSGFNYFCDAAEDAGVMDCKRGGKEAYGTYLKNIGKLKNALADYKQLDPWTQAAMMTKVSKGNQLAKGTAKLDCFAGKYTVSDLRDIASAFDIPVSGNKVNICMQLQTALSATTPGKAVLAELFKGNDINFANIAPGADAVAEQNYLKDYFPVGKKTRKTKPSWTDIANKAEWSYTGNF